MMRRGSARIRRGASWPAAGIAIGVLLRACGADAAILSSARLERIGKVVELRFALKGRGGKAHLNAHGSQLWIDLDNTRSNLPPRPFYGREAPPVDLVRTVDAGGGRARVVIEVNQRADYAMARLPHELLVRLAPAGAVADLAAPSLTMMNHPAPAAKAISVAPPRGAAPAPAGAQLAALRPPAPRNSTPLEIAPAPGRPRPLVMIDPGHGGFDSGTEAGAPLIEKMIALAIATRLARDLEARGIRAELTRNADYFVTLPERTRLANRAGADLFVSIHLNSSPNPDTSGIETYYLDNTTDRATIRLARMENASGGRYSASQPGGLNYILSDLRQNYKAGVSAALAQMIEAWTVANLDSSLGIRINELGAKKGPFYVLVGALMPAVLVECGFLSNRTEAARLAAARYQEVLAGAVADAVVNYFKSDVAAGNL